MTSVRKYVLAIFSILLVCSDSLGDEIQKDTLVCTLYIEIDGEEKPFSVSKVLVKKYDHSIKNWGLITPMRPWGPGKFFQRREVSIGDSFRFEITGHNGGELNPPKEGITDAACLEHGIKILIDKSQLKKRIESGSLSRSTFFPH